MSKVKDIISIRYGRLLVVKFLGTIWTGRVFRAYWLCECDCGNRTKVSGAALQSGNTKSCGCLQRKVASEQTGENNPHYVKGKYTKEILELKESIRKRDGYKCQKCGKTQEQNLKEINKKLSVHHIDGDDTNNVEENMITYCNSCHGKQY